MIINAIKNAYDTMHARKWDTLYWAIDLHGVCLESTYTVNEHRWISADAIAGLQSIDAQPENKIILWSAVYDEDKLPIVSMFADKGIKIIGFNENPEVFNTDVSFFNEKFYFNILLDDKAGFNHHTDWSKIIEFYAQRDGRKW